MDLIYYKLDSKDGMNISMNLVMLVNGRNAFKQQSIFIKDH